MDREGLLLKALEKEDNILREVDEKLERILGKVEKKLEGVEKELERFKKELREFGKKLDELERKVDEQEKLDREFNRRERMLVDLENLRWAMKYILHHNRKYSGYEMYRVRKGDGINSTRTKWVRHPFF